ncbi:cold-shock protein [Pandoraea oxalativorans]|uniref:Cold-shock protein n=1 Tax=Pandoraea oxalativorans TaxID=573737 RepID=A0A0E3U728_9BURK|nr:cold shock domain-containing protein [Pandoraea oxalativorans]AKC70504.1 cold-shock protein [Pandoraea oxalativorans]
MAQGKVKWFDSGKGYGYIILENSGEDVFFHFSAVTDGGEGTLSPDTPVEFDVTKSPKGLQAMNVKALRSS